MAYSPLSNQGLSGQRTLADINITPLVDVMLVLLVIFMIAAPTLAHRIDLDLPQAAPTAPTPAPDPVRVRVDASGEVYWNQAAQPLSALEALLSVEAQRDPGNQPRLQIQASGDADYGVVTQVLAAARNAGMAKIDFVQD